jgi:class 3 adenylate cyclase
MSLQVRILRAHGGDIDKMIGDAILARFDGDDGAQRALGAAEEILTTVGQFDFPRALGIGIYRGSVISGAIGPEDRRDFTVIGDSVNVAARLCSAANANEIVVDANLTDQGFGPLEKITVKGRTAPLVIRRKHMTTKTAPSET